jgi:hypothetical protein
LPLTAGSFGDAPLLAKNTTLPRRRNNSLSPNTAFLNIPYDKGFESLFLAYVAGLCGFGLVPRATLEIPGGSRRLDRIFRLIGECRYSFHDLSRVELDKKRPPTPRFNMPFELGLVVAWTKTNGKRHDWFVFESRRQRLSKSLSDLDGTDPHIHRRSPRILFRCLTNALVRSRRQPTVIQLEKIFSDLKKAAIVIKQDLKTSTLFEARPFKELVVAATRSANNRVP